MDKFVYRNEELFCEEVPVSEIISQMGTPCYIYSANTFIDHYRTVASAFSEVDPLICYSVKSNSNSYILRLLTSEGSGFDVVSGGELFRAIQSGGDPKKMVYAGVGKTDEEINQALDVGIGWFNVESVPELENLRKITSERKVSANGALRINPDIDPKTHRKTATGKKHSKFGVDIERAEDIFRKYANHDYFSLTGMHLHIGSPIPDAKPYVQAITKVMKLVDLLRADGCTIDTLDIGGGFAADYTTDQSPCLADYAKDIVPLVKGSGLKIILEPGRTISGNAGILVTKVLYVKESTVKTFAIVDAGMNDLVRPAMYDAFHFIWPVEVSENQVPARREEKPDLVGLKKFDVVGPICESSDCFASERFLPELNRGNLLAIYTAGAYGFTMASQYNSHPRPPEVMVQDKLTKVVRRRETYQDLIEPENL